jgi:cell division protein FtsL
LPQFFKENNVLVKLSLEMLNERSINQYQIEERSRLVRRIKHSQKILEDLFKTMEKETLSKPEKIIQLAKELSIHHNDDGFKDCKNMIEILRLNLHHLNRN